MSAKPTRRAARRAANPVKYLQIGGWDMLRKLKVPSGLYRATIFTPIDLWNEYVVARDLAT